ncbi:hypothetical protein BDZ45DRAFT_246623 [Acephala macrosclerotiorum]|nr:hypothetical protein BDZ45DRAFT_246623 [Acephala macrosclerotiorum]
MSTYAAPSLAPMTMNNPSSTHHANFSTPNTSFPPTLANALSQPAPGNTPAPTTNPAATIVSPASMPSNTLIQPTKPTNNANTTIPSSASTDPTSTNQTSTSLFPHTAKLARKYPGYSIQELTRTSSPFLSPIFSPLECLSKRSIGFYPCQILHLVIPPFPSVLSPIIPTLSNQELTTPK